jgi:hypothetical protein
MRRWHGLLLLLALASCGGPETGPEEALRAWVREGQAAAENKDRQELLSRISPAYADARGNGRDDIDKLLRIYFFRQDKVALMSRIERLEVFGESAAQLALRVGMAGTNRDTRGFRADAYRFEMELEHDGDDWLLIAASWGGLGEQVH